MLFTLSLKKNASFRQAYKSGRPAADYLLVLYARPNHTEINRLGVSVGKKVGKAVKRNRVKRWIREAYRLSEPGIIRGYDLVVAARPPAGMLEGKNSFDRIKEALRRILDKQRLLLHTEAEM